MRGAWRAGRVRSRGTAASAENSRTDSSQRLNGLFETTQRQSVRNAVGACAQAECARTECLTQVVGAEEDRVAAGGNSAHGRCTSLLGSHTTSQ